jgi:hypothetical protein
MEAAFLGFGDSTVLHSCLQPVEKGCHCWLVQQCKGINSRKTLLDKPAVAPKFIKLDFFNRLLIPTCVQARTLQKTIYHLLQIAVAQYGPKTVLFVAR